MITISLPFSIFNKHLADVTYCPPPWLTSNELETIQSLMNRLGVVLHKTKKTVFTNCYSITLLSQEIKTYFEQIDNNTDISFLNQQIEKNDPFIDNPNALSQVLDLLQHLVNRGHTCDIAANTGIETIAQRLHLPQETDPSILEQAAHLLQSTIDKECAAALITAATTTRFNSLKSAKNPRALLHILDLFQNLVDQGHLHDVAAQAAIDLLDRLLHLPHQTPTIDWLAKILHLLESVIKKESVIDRVTEAAVAHFNSTNIIDKEIGLFLFTPLLEAGYAIDAAINIAKSQINYDELEIKELTFRLLHTLVKQGYAHDFAQKTALEHLDGKCKTSANTLLWHLKKAGYYTAHGKIL